MDPPFACPEYDTLSYPKSQKEETRVFDQNLNYRVCVLDAGKKGYAVGIYQEGGEAVFGSSGHEARFPQVISKLAKLAQSHPEAFHKIDIHLGPGKDFQEECALEEFRRAVYTLYEEVIKGEQGERL